MKAPAASLLVTVVWLAAPPPAAAWSVAWCQSDQAGHPTAAGTAWCALHAPRATPPPAPSAPPGPPGGAHSPALDSPPPDVDPVHQGQHQTVINAPHTTNVNTAASNASAAGSAQVTNYVGASGSGGQQNLPVAPLADCGSGASLSIGGEIGHDSGFVPLTSSLLYAAATFPIGRRHCTPGFAPVAPVTNIYSTIAAPAAAPAPPVIIREAAPPGRSGQAAPRCAFLSRFERAARLDEIHRLRHRHASVAIARDLRLLRAACVPDLLIAQAIDG